MFREAPTLMPRIGTETRSAAIREQSHVFAFHRWPAILGLIRKGYFLATISSEIRRLR